MKVHATAFLLVTLLWDTSTTTVQAGSLPRFKPKHHHLAFIKRDGGDPGWTSKQDSKFISLPLAPSQSFADLPLFTV